METLTVKVPNGKIPDVSTFVKKIGGEIVSANENMKIETDIDNEVTHEVFFGENIKRLMKAFSK